MKIGQSYEGMPFDTASRLWWRGVWLAALGDAGLSVKLANLAWFSILLMVPGALARLLILFRFNRAEIVERLRRTFSRTTRYGGGTR